MSALLQLRYALGRWLVAPVIRLPKEVTQPKINLIGGEFTMPRAVADLFRLQGITPGSLAKHETTARPVDEPAPAAAAHFPDAEERALIWRDAMRLADQGGSVICAVADVAEARALLRAVDLSAPWESAARWDEARGGRSK
jgi:hypothetical protein